MKRLGGIFFVSLIVMPQAVGFSGEHRTAPAPNTPLTKAQQQTVEQLNEEYAKSRKRYSNPSSPAITEETLSNLDPILVGRNIVFSKNWLDFVGSGKPLSRPQFVRWRSNLDRLYDGFVDFLGCHPPYGEKIFIELVSIGSRDGMRFIDNMVFIDKAKPAFIPRLIEVAENDSLDLGLVYGIGSVFVGRKLLNKHKWCADPVTMTDFLEVYAIEVLGANLGLKDTVRTPSGPFVKLDRYTPGSDILRKERAKDQLQAYKSGFNMQPFAEGNSSVYGLYMYNLVDIVGWDTFKKAFHSYHNDAYKASKEYTTKDGDRYGKEKAIFREFFDRIVYFNKLSEKQILSQLPDKGKLLNTHFDVIVVNLSRQTATRTPLSDEAIGEQKTVASKTAIPRTTTARTPVLTKVQQQTVEKMKEERLAEGKGAWVEQNLSNLDPILVGRNIVFSKKWIEFVGNGKPISREHFARWRDNLDRLYDGFEDLLGAPPPGYEKMFIFLEPLTTPGLANHRGVFINNDINSLTNKLESVAKHDLWDGTMIHEIGHVFTARLRWCAEPEAATNLLTAYAVERLNASLGFGYSDKMKVTWWRETHMHEALQGYESGNLLPFAYQNKSAYDLYMFSLVDIVGWDTFRKTFRSYNDNAYTPTKTYVSKTGDRGGKARFREFFDRLVYFSNLSEKQILSRLPDKGKMLDTHFDVDVTVRDTPSRRVRANSTDDDVRGGVAGDFRNFEQLELRSAERLTDACLSHLAKLKNLKSLTVTGYVNITEEGIAELRKALPKCKIEFNR